ncbi:MAG: S-adenosylmethionine synthetase N-terminal domain-containing protein, partial [Bacteroidia bacterium]
MSYLFTSESVSEGHPDKIADQISDAIIDEFLRYDSSAKVACETFVTTGLVVVGGEIKTTPEVKGKVDVQSVVRRVISEIGYNKSEYQFDAISCGILNTLHEQSADINRGVDRGNDEEQGAGDQGMMFGYASKETDNYMPLPLELSHLLLQDLADIRKEGKKMKYLRPDAKSQVTIQYSDKGKPEKIETIVISTQHDDFADEKVMLEKIKAD